MHNAHNALLPQLGFMRVEDGLTLAANAPRQFESYHSGEAV